MAVKTAKDDLKYIICLIVLGIAAVAVAAVILCAHQRYSEDKKAYDDISDSVRLQDESLEAESPENVIKDSEAGGASGSSDDSATRTADDAIRTDNAIRMDDAVGGIDPIIDFAKLSSINGDSVAWLNACGGEIDGPVVSSVDDDYYLKHRFDGTASSAGTFFVDRLCDRPFENMLTAVYGHNRKDGSMFHPLLAYKDYDYYLKNPEIVLQTENAMLSYEVVSAYYSDSSGVFGSLSRSDIPGINSPGTSFDADRAALIQTFIDKRLYDTYSQDRPLKETDKYIMLITCEYSGNDNRMVVVGRLKDAFTVYMH